MRLQSFLKKTEISGLNLSFMSETSYRLGAVAEKTLSS